MASTSSMTTDDERVENKLDWVEKGLFDDVRR